MSRALRRRAADEVASQRRQAVDDATLAAAKAIVDDVRSRGVEALIEHARRLGDLEEGQEPVISRAELDAALKALPVEQRALLERTAERVRAFAAAQRASLTDLDFPLPGGRAGHSVAPVTRAGCYAPGGRFPLPSSVLMTAVTARVAGVETVWVASPRPTLVTRAAAAVAGADALLRIGGAQAIAALAYGVGGPPACDVIVGPGNRWVTAAKQLIAGRTAIDMLAGPSELVVVADDAADPAIAASDLLAQAEHDPDALPILIALSADIAEAIDGEVASQLATLPTIATAREAVAAGYSVVARDRAQAQALCDRIAPEHLALFVEEPRVFAAGLNHYGALFLGGAASEVLGDYGAGPNHVLPTGGTARSIGGLSVLNFLRVRTFLDMEPGAELDALARDARDLARLEGLEAHARAAERRISGQ